MVQEGNGWSNGEPAGKSGWDNDAEKDKTDFSDDFLSGIPSHWSGNAPPVSEFVGRLEQVGGRTVEYDNNKEGQRLVLVFDWIDPLKVREGMAIERGAEFRVEMNMGYTNRSGMKKFGDSLAILQSGASGGPQHLVRELKRLARDKTLIHMVAIDEYLYGVDRRSGDKMLGVVWQVHDILIQGSETGELYSMKNGEQMFGVDSFHAEYQENERQRQEREFPAVKKDENKPVAARPQVTPGASQAVTPAMPDFAEYDFTEFLNLIDQGMPWQEFRSLVRNKYNTDPLMTNAIYASAGGLRDYLQIAGLVTIQDEVVFPAVMAS